MQTTRSDLNHTETVIDLDLTEAAQFGQAPVVPLRQAKTTAQTTARRQSHRGSHLPMSSYRYEVVTISGDTKKGKVRAASREQAAAILADSGIELRKLKKVSSWNTIELGGRKVKAKELIIFTRQLATFVEGGIPLLDALTSIGSDSASVNLQDTLREMAIDLAEGFPLSEAMVKHPGIFPDFYVNMVRAGELTGHLPEVLANLSEYMERADESKKAVRTALIYPSIIGVLSIATVITLVMFVLPRFVTFFDKLGSDLPVSAKIMIGGSSWMRTNWYWLTLGFAVAVLLLVMWLHTDGGKRTRDVIVLKLPVVGDLVRYAAVERICHTLAVMVRAGVPLATSFNIVIDISKNKVFQEGLASVQGAMMAGWGMSRPIAQTGLFPPLVSQMIQVGEDAGSLEDQLAKAADFYSKELTYKIKQFTALFEPAMIIFMALIVGFVAVTLVQTMYGIYQQSGA